MTSKDEQVQTTIAEQASEWFVANDAESLGAQESAALGAWLTASPRHIEEFLGVAVIARDLRAASAEPEHSVESLVARARADHDRQVRPLLSQVFATVSQSSIPRWQTAAVTLATLGLVSLGLLGLWHLRLSPQVPVTVSSTALHFETHHGEVQTDRLADGSLLHLNTDTVLTVRYSKTERVVTLASGQAAFEVAHAPERPFHVFAGSAETIALGTQFDVRMGDGSTVITVIEGRIAVGLTQNLEQHGGSSDQVQPPRLVELGADQQIRVSKDELPTSPTTVDAQRATAWLHRQISFDHEPLERVAAEFNRYAAKPIEITTPGLRKLEITGTFSTDDSEEFIAFLRSLKGVRVDVTDTDIRVSNK